MPHPQYLADLDADVATLRATLAEIPGKIDLDADGSDPMRPPAMTTLEWVDELDIDLRMVIEGEELPLEAADLMPVLQAAIDLTWPSKQSEGFLIERPTASGWRAFGRPLELLHDALRIVCENARHCTIRDYRVRAVEDDSYLIPWQLWAGETWTPGKTP